MRGIVGLVVLLIGLLGCYGSVNSGVSPLDAYTYVEVENNAFADYRIYFVRDGTSVFQRLGVVNGLSDGTFKTRSLLDYSPVRFYIDPIGGGSNYYSDLFQVERGACVRFVIMSQLNGSYVLSC